MPLRTDCRISRLILERVQELGGRHRGPGRGHGACRIRRGVRSAESEPAPVDWTLLDTPVWAEFSVQRGFGQVRPLPEQMAQLGLAERVVQEWVPRRAAVLLFAEEPGGPLAALGTRAEVRFMVYRGKAAEAGAKPSMKKPPRTLRGPLIRLIDNTLEDDAKSKRQKHLKSGRLMHIASR